MFFRKKLNSSKEAFIVLSLLLFFFSGQVSLTLYVDSSYLVETISNTPSLSAMKIWEDPENAVGSLYTMASLVTLLLLTIAPRALRRFGNYQWTLWGLVAHTILLLALGNFNSAWLIIPMFMLETAIVSTLYFNFDIFLERFSRDEDTGVIRGVMLTIGSIAWLLPPALAGYLIDSMGYSAVYLTGAAIVIPTIFLMMRYFSDFQDLQYDDGPILWPKELHEKHPDIANALTINFIMHAFYATMIIYAPLYFVGELGYSHKEWGLMLTMALAAFVIFPSPTGWLADRVLGEKELLVASFILMGITTLAIPYLAPLGVMTFALWALLLFVGRMGAATLETMIETYFFKKIDGRAAVEIGYFRRARPLAFIVAPLIATILLQTQVVAIPGLFAILGTLMLFSVYFPLRLHDTR